MQRGNTGMGGDDTRFFGNEMYICIRHTCQYFIRADGIERCDAIVK